MMEYPVKSLSVIVVVGPIERGTNLRSVRKLMQTYGFVEHVEMKPGHAIVIFSSEESAQRALSIETALLLGKEVGIEKCVRYNNKIFVEGFRRLASTCNARKFFERYGKIFKLEISEEANKYQQRDNAYITYYSDISAEKAAVESLHEFKKFNVYVLLLENSIDHQYKKGAWPTRKFDQQKKAKDGTMDTDAKNRLVQYQNKKGKFNLLARLKKYQLASSNIKCRKLEDMCTCQQERLHICKKCHKQIVYGSEMELARINQILAETAGYDFSIIESLFNNDNIQYTLLFFAFIGLLCSIFSVGSYIKN